VKIAKGQLSLPVCKKMVVRHIKRLWQQRWDRSITGRVTYELIVWYVLLGSLWCFQAISVIAGYC